jgi:exonuclease V gamma subunit
MLRIYRCQDMPAAWADLHRLPTHQTDHSANESINASIDALFSPATSEQWLVTSDATRQWLRLETARKHGIYAQQPIEFVAGYLWQLIAQCGPQLPDYSPFEPAIAVWQIQSIFESLTAEQLASDYLPLRSSLLNADAITRYNVAYAVAQLFDQYLVYRIEWLLAWQAGKLVNLPDQAQERWQQKCWQLLVTKLPKVQAEHPFATLEKNLTRANALAPRLPKHLVVFGVDGLAPLYLRALSWIGQRTQVTLYAFKVSDGFHQDLVTHRQSLREQLANPQAAAYFEIAHPLLASWGLAVAHQSVVFDMIAEQSKNVVIEESADQLPAANAYLHALQTSILTMDGDDQQAIQDRAPDVSLQILNCHSLVRQLECVQDQLRQAFVELPNLSASEILIVATDVQAVERLLPGCWDNSMPVVIGGSLAHDNPWTLAFEQWLQFGFSAASSLSLVALIEWVRDPVVVTALNLELSDANLWSSWFSQAGIHHAGRDVPDQSTISKHGLARGIERLLLSVAVDESIHNVASRYSAGDVGESGVPSLARLIGLIERLEQFQFHCKNAQPMSAWGARLISELQGFMNEQGTSIDAMRDSLADGRQIIAQLVKQFDRSGLAPDTPLDSALILQAWRQQSESQVKPVSPSGSILVAPVGAVRHLPYRVIAWVGLDDGVWPRPVVARLIDLKPQRPQAGDSNSRVQDRAEFLESVLLPTDRLLLCYNGRDPRKNSPINPSAVVSELLQFLPKLIPQLMPLSALKPTQKKSQRLNDLVFLNEAMLAPQNQSSVDATESTPFVAQASLAQLQAFLSDASRHFAQNGLLIKKPWQDQSVDESLPWALDKKSAALMMSQMAQQLIQGDDSEQQWDDFPAGAPGLVGDEQTKMTMHSAAIALQAQDALQVDRLVSIEGKLNASQLLQTWVDHLFACASADGKPPVTGLFSWSTLKWDGVLLGVNTDDAHQAIEQLREAYVHGALCPLPLFAGGAMAWLKNNQNVEAIHKAIVGGDDSANSFVSADLDRYWAGLVWRGAASDQNGQERLVAQALVQYKQYLAPLAASFVTAAAYKRRLTPASP